MTLRALADPPTLSAELARVQLVDRCVYQIASAPLPLDSTVAERRWARDVCDSVEKLAEIGEVPWSYDDDSWSVDGQPF